MPITSLRKQVRHFWERRAAYWSDACCSPPPAVNDPELLLSLAEFAALRGVDTGTMQNYVEDSLLAWTAGRDGTLPLPDDTQPAAHGLRYRWRHDRAAA